MTADDMPQPDLKHLEESIEPAAERRSKLEPYRDVILRWRCEGHSFRRIQAALDKNGVKVALMTLHEFVERRERLAEVVAEIPQASAAEPKRKRTPEEIAELRRRASAANHRPSEDEPEAPAKFEYDPARPLTNKPTE